jgi:hypothetical protein
LTVVSEAADLVHKQEPGVNKYALHVPLDSSDETDFWAVEEYGFYLPLNQELI